MKLDERTRRNWAAASRHLLLVQSNSRIEERLFVVVRGVRLVVRCTSWRRNAGRWRVVRLAVATSDEEATSLNALK
jgi:hypothetical protein